MPVEQVFKKVYASVGHTAVSFWVKSATWLPDTSFLYDVSAILLR